VERAEGAASGSGGRSGPDGSAGPQGSPEPEVGSGRDAQAARRQPTEPVAVDTSRIVVAGLACWAVALVVVLAVPDLHTGGRDWWPWACVAGLVLGGLGLVYVRRGRGSAALARRR
jgi:hypothetical protein